MTGSLLPLRRRVIAAATPAELTQPDEIANLAMWIDASQETTLVDGADVETFTDWSGNGNHGSTWSSTTRPSFDADGLSGHPAFRCDGVDERIVIPAVVTITAGTMFVVFQQATSPQSSRAVVGCRVSSSGNLGRWYLFADSTNGFTVTVGATNTGPVGAGVPQDLLPHVGVIRADGTAKTVWMDDETESFVDSHTGTINNGRALGSLVHDVNASAFWNGWIAEVIHYSRALTDEEVADVQAYIANKYGL